MQYKENRAYHDQKRRAARRDVAFKFTYQEWAAWWMKYLGPNWFDRRGPYRGQFVMARKGDKGPYATWNVQCVLCTDNHKQRPVNKTSSFGERHSNSKLTENDVIYIRRSGLSISELAGRFKVSKQALAQARNGLRWGYLNSKHPPVKGRGR